MGYSGSDVCIPADEASGCTTRSSSTAGLFTRDPKPRLLSYPRKDGDCIFEGPVREGAPCEPEILIIPARIAGYPVVIGTTRELGAAVMIVKLERFRPSVSCRVS